MASIAARNAVSKGDSSNEGCGKAWSSNRRDRGTCRCCGTARTASTASCCVSRRAGTNNRPERHLAGSGAGASVAASHVTGIAHAPHRAAQPCPCPRCLPARDAAGGDSSRDFHLASGKRCARRRGNSEARPCGEKADARYGPKITVPAPTVTNSFRWSDQRMAYRRSSRLAVNSAAPDEGTVTVPTISNWLMSSAHTPTSYVPGGTSVMR